MGRFNKVGSKVKSFLRARETKYGVNALIFCVAVIGIVVLVNILIARRHIRFDLTKNREFSLSDQTLKVIAGLEKKVLITAFFKEATYEQQWVKDLLREYEYKSKNIEVKFVDPDKDPSTTANFGIKSYGTTIVQCGTNRKDIPRREVFTINYMTRQSEFKGEEVFTSAIVAVAQAEQKKIYFLKGHQEHNPESTEEQGYSEVKDYLKKENYKVEGLNIAEKGEVPQDCSALVVAGPKIPLMKKEKEVIEEYLEGGGSLFLLIDPQVYLARFKELLAKYNMAVGDDLVVDPARCFFFDAVTPIPEFKYHEITEELRSQRVGAIFPGARSVSKIDEEKTEVTISALLKTSSESWAETNFTGGRLSYDKGKDTKGPITLGLAAEKSLAEEKQIRLVVIGDSDFANNANLRAQGNVDFFLNAVNWLVGEAKKISIRPKSPDVRRVSMSKLQARLIYYICLFVTPAAVLFSGGVIWLRRRRS